ncbi:MAG: hypothetical protein J6U85_06460 [Bacteroidales bacterium]|jgi:hypothetical protein|nr:hypothetical protein [Bacteroidales bacterium]
MKKFLVILVFFLGFNSCIDTPYNPNTPDVYINFEIYPNSTMYYELNTIAGWMYVNAPWPSRGIIIFRHPSGEFKAYERQSPNEPDYCGESSRLIVDSPFVVDTCLDVKYSILDGSIITPGYNGYPLIEYRTQYDGHTLRVFN